MEITHEFDWSSLIIIGATVLGFIVSEVKNWIARKKHGIEDDLTLKNKLSAVHSELKKLESETEKKINHLHKKIDDKNGVIFNKISDMEKKIDDKFDKLTNQIFELIKTINFGKEK